MNTSSGNNNAYYEKMQISVREDNGLYDLVEIINELETYYNNFETDAMNDRVLFLRGQKDMLEKIITYLKNVL